MRDYKIKIVILSFLFSLGLSSFSAWSFNSMCHSPVQLAAFMSPNKPKLSTGERLRKQITAKEQQIERYENKMDDIEGDLGDTLSQEKLNDDPYSVASEVRGYIENKQSGWPCALSSSLFPDQPFNLFSSIDFLNLILPSAYADKSIKVAPGGKTANQPPAPTILELECAGRNGDWTYTKADGCKCNPPLKEIGGNCRIQTAQEECKGRSGVWTYDPSTVTQDGHSSLEDPCQCKSPRFKDDNGECRLKTAQEECEERSGDWIFKGDPMNVQGHTMITDDQCKCNPKTHVEEGKNCRPKTITDVCPLNSGTGWFLNEAKDKCICPEASHQVLSNRGSGKDCSPIGEQALCEKNIKKEWKDDNCVCKDAYLERTDGTCADCPVDSHITKEGKCTPKGAAEKCFDQKKIYNAPNCDCPIGFTEQADETCVKDKCKQKWKEHGSFRKNGKVDSSFCSAYAKNKKACENALAKLQRLGNKLEDYETDLDKLNDKLLGLDDSEDRKTEAGGLCFDCLKRQLKASRPTAGQTFGNISSMLLGTGISMLGHNTGKRAQMDANMLRLQQGYPISNDNYALQGSAAGFPFIANGLHGMTRVNTPVGGWSCTPSVSPYGHTHAYSYNHGHRMPYYY